MNKMQRGGYGPVEWGKQSAREFKRTERKRTRAAKAAGPPATAASRGIQNPAAAKRAKAAVKAGAKARRKNSRSLQRRLVKVK